MRIATARFVLRPLVAADAPALLELGDWLGVHDLEGVRARLRGWESRTSPDGSETWLNWLVADDVPAAWVQATIRGDVAKVAYAVLPARRRQGVAAEAVTAVTAWLHEQGVALVEADIDERNVASQAVARSAGFVRTPRRSHGETVWEHVTS